MAYKILEDNSVLNENVDGGGFNNFTASNQDGVLKGILNECVVYQPSSTSLGVSTGEILAKGVRIKITEDEIFNKASLPAVAEQRQIVAQVTLTSDRTLTGIILDRLKVELKQDELWKFEQGVYEVEIAEYTLSNEGITNLKSKLKIISSKGLTEEEVNALIDSKLKNISGGLSENEIKELIKKELENVSTGLTEEQVNALIDNKLQNFSGGITEERVNEIVEEKGFATESDLAGKLDKVTAVTTYSQIYCKGVDGGQLMYNFHGNAVGNTIALRVTGGALNVGNPTANSHATPKSYVDTTLKEKLNAETEAIYNILNQTVIGTEEVTAELAGGRTTANGLSGLIDGSYTRLEKVQGTSYIVDGAMLVNSIFKEIISYLPYDEESGTQTEIDRLSINNEVTLGEYDYIDFERGVIVRQTSEPITLDGYEEWRVVNGGAKGGNPAKTRFALYKTYIAYENNKDINVVAPFYSEYQAVTAEDTYYGVKGIGASGENINVFDDNYAIEIGSADDTQDNRDNALFFFKEHLKELFAMGTPLMIVYKLANPTEESITIPKNKYKVAVGGEEMVETYNAVAVKTTNTYIVKKGV